jgi:hypothetical protein
MRGDTERKAPAVAILATAALAWLAAPGVPAAEGAASQPPPQERPADAAERRAGPAAFLSDTELTLRLRSHWVDVVPASGPEREAWAVGGWLAYRSGWLLDVFRIGATEYGAAPVHAPRSKGETLLLAPGREGYHVLGEAFAALRFRRYATVKAYRQAVDEPYISRQDNAMTPNTFQGVTAAGAMGSLEYAGGYLARIKTRNADRFVPLSEAAGARGSDEGVAMFRITVVPLPGLEILVAEQYGIDTFATLFIQVEHVGRLGRDVQLQFGAQLSDQRAVGAALVGTTRVARWDTQSGSARLALTRGGLTLTAASSVTATGNRVLHPWGFYPGYLRMDQQTFDNAGEKAWLVGIAYDARAFAPGLTAFARVARGVDSIDPVTRADLGDEAEYDLVIAFRPTRVAGLLFRGRALLYEREGAARLGNTLRFTINWEIPILRSAEGSSRRGDT